MRKLETKVIRERQGEQMQTSTLQKEQTNAMQ